METSKEKKSLSRVPQSLAFDNTALNRTYGEEAAVIRDVIVYVANSQVKNLFGEVQFSIEEFCKAMGYSRTTLSRTIERFKESPKNIPEVDGHKFDSPFEYALYRGLKENVIFRRKRDGKETFESVQLIEKLDVLFDRTTKKDTKRTYCIRLGYKILDYLFTEYNLIDFNEYRSLKSQQIAVTGSLRNFYIFMARVITQIKYSKKQGLGDTFIISIDDLCNIYDVAIGTAKDKKKYITKVLNNMNNDLSNMKFDWQYIKNGGRFAYHVEFKFTDETLDYFDEQLRAVFYKKLYENMQRFFLISGKDTGVPSESYYPEKLKNMDRQKYIDWFFLEDEDTSDKQSIFRETYIKVYGVEYNPTDNYLL